MFGSVLKTLSTNIRNVSFKQLCKTTSIWPNRATLKPLNEELRASPFSTLTTQPSPLLLNPKLQEISTNITRNVIKFSWQKGTRKTVRTVLRRFYRLNWGIWIRTKAGRHKRLWVKHAGRKRRLRQHVFCNATQSRMLDKMVNNFWRRPKYYVDDPYEPYHTREEFHYTYKKPRPSKFFD